MRADRRDHRVFKYIGEAIENSRICVKLMNYLWGNGSAHQRACLKALENLHAKYAVTATEIEQQRDAATAKLKRFLKELGYE